jgi:hypothetical protein
MIWFHLSILAMLFAILYFLGLHFFSRGAAVNPPSFPARDAPDDREHLVEETPRQSFAREI